MLKKEDVFIHDVDFTRDYKGVFNKDMVVRHLMQHGFGMQNTVVGEPTIIDNNASVSRNCLTFIRDTDNGTVRYKFYNKFVQSMESPSVRRRIGSHVAHWCNNPESELKVAIPKSLDTGLLRLEITFYRRDGRRYLDEEFVEEQMDFLEQQIPPNLLYFNPISTQYALLLEHVQSNVCIVDTDKSTALFSLYLNKETAKQTDFT
jgi:hypothetical protein